MNDTYKIEITMKESLSQSLFSDCNDLNAFKRWLIVVMLLAMTRQKLATHKIYLHTLNQVAKFSLS